MWQVMYCRDVGYYMVNSRNGILSVDDEVFAQRDEAQQMVDKLNDIEASIDDDRIWRDEESDIRKGN